MALDVFFATIVTNFSRGHKIPWPEPMPESMGPPSTFGGEGRSPLKGTTSSSISYYPIWKLICEGDLGVDENKFRILMSRSLGEVIWMGFPERTQNVESNCVPCQSPQKAFTAKPSIIRNMSVISFLSSCLISSRANCLQRQQYSVCIT